MATHSSILSWRTPWTEEPGGSQSQTPVRDERFVCVCVLSWVRLFATPWTIAHQPPLSMGFSRQELIFKMGVVNPSGVDEKSK